ncbi:SMI1/KNR4 family protein [Streptomyces sp. NPDC092296]|uniref:SMI1/KNR4 family protein n=1 Tax=Streptomyces sp. NPDC092296 TaxID=3366012 RepID=UPI0037F10539
MDDIHRHDDLIRRVRERAAKRCPDLPPPVSAPELAAAEAALGLPLHPLLARLYREVADGGFGPGYGFFRLGTDKDGGPDRTEGPLTAAYPGPGAVDPADEDWFWPEGVVPFLTWGCGMLACVDCRSPEGTVLLFEPNAVGDDWSGAWFLDADSLADWLETSLSGGGWYNGPDADDDWSDDDSDDERPAAGETSAEPRPWGPEARARAGRPG